MTPVDEAKRKLVSEAYKRMKEQLKHEDHFPLLPSSSDVHAMLVQSGEHDVTLGEVMDHCIALEGHILADMDTIEPTRKNRKL